MNFKQCNNYINNQDLSLLYLYNIGLLFFLTHCFNRCILHVEQKLSCCLTTHEQTQHENKVSSSIVKKKIIAPL